MVAVPVGEPVFTHVIVKEPDAKRVIVPTTLLPTLFTSTSEAPFVANDAIAPPDGTVAML